MQETNAKTFDQTDIEQVKELQGSYATTTAQIGQVEVELHLLEKRLRQIQDMRVNLFNTYEELQSKEQDLVKSLNEKYGDGVLDLDSGTFIPSTT
jgi:predicted nuclease with TOPRIM domain